MKRFLIFITTLTLTFSSFSQNYNEVFSDSTYIEKNKINTELIEIYYRGKKLSLKGKSKASLKKFTKCIKIEPNFIPAYFERGKEFKKNKEYDKAIQDFSQIILQDNNLKEAYILRLYTKIAKTTPDFKADTYLTPPTRIYKQTEISSLYKKSICEDLQILKELNYEVKNITDLSKKYCEY
ncbi:Tetratricopeptide repeat-containing protein [Flaviramulus basaltis]|uniref:Tetratricopeptide repeat-containing protein n=1 Tax=Flaviramulus basaltis TaxID=369401 RepID=A0A1K2ILN9_9FLAO|nr:tetratricopeptide repeat protein [Flaviramulus basaltis]SFZ92587.1 Tetratricopeptide repeat-containing protein [Flaviramulus basaltis]